MTARDACSQLTTNGFAENVEMVALENRINVGNFRTLL